MRIYFYNFLLLGGQLRRSGFSLEASVEASEMGVYEKFTKTFGKGLLRHNNQEHLRQVSGWCGLSDGATVLLKIDNLIEACQLECGSLV